MSKIVQGKQWPTNQPFVGFAPGDWTFSSDDEHPKWLRFGCPRGTGECTVPIRPQTTRDGHGWNFDGNRDAPTLTPSINCLSEYNGHPSAGCGWHGHVRAGRFEEC